jgi:hypothetical protein
MCGSTTVLSSTRLLGWLNDRSGENRNRLDRYVVETAKKNRPSGVLCNAWSWIWLNLQFPLFVLAIRIHIFWGRGENERIRLNSSETIFVLIFFRFGIKADSVQIRIRNRSLSVTNTDRIRGGYGSVADKHFIGSLFKIKIELTSGAKISL